MNSNEHPTDPQRVSAALGSLAVTDTYTDAPAVAWPKWPRVPNVDRVLHSFRRILEGRVWTVRAPGSALSATEEAETAFAKFTGSKHALLVASGTQAVEVAIRALQLPPQAEVIVPALGWFATAAAVRRAGAVPVFADVDPRTSCISPEAVSRCLSLRTGAIVAVHLHCAVCDMHALKQISDTAGVPVIEDCAQAHGARYDGVHVGNLGAIGCFSFNQEKLIPVGEGGAVVTNDQALFERLYACRTDGYLNVRHDGREFVPHGSIMGGNACMSEFEAAILMEQLNEFQTLQTTRLQTAAELRNALKPLKFVSILDTALGTTERSWHEFAFKLSDHAFGGRTLDEIGDTIQQAVGFAIHATDEPTQACPMLHHVAPHTPAPNAEAVHRSLLVFHHSVLLDSRVIEILPRAIYKTCAAS